MRRRGRRATTGTSTAVGAGVVAILACDTACAPPPVADAGHVVVEHALPGAHSHNDETRDAPLDQALSLRFASIEVDVFVYEGSLVAGHDLFTIAGGLDALYLAPLQERVDARGSVYGDGARFDLWIDLKSGDTAVRDAVHEALSAYPMIARFGAGAGGGAVRVILTGDEASKAAYVDERDERLACRDTNYLRMDDPPVDDRFCAYALDFRVEVGDWDGGGDAPPDVVAALDDVVARAAATDRPLRLWGAPDTPSSWRAQKAAGVDWVGADDLAGLAETYE